MGEFFAILSATLFGAANVLINKGATPLSQDNGVFISLLLTFTIAGVLAVIMGLYRGWPVLNATGIYWFAFAGVLTAFLGRVFLFSSIQHLGSVRASAIKRLNPFFAVIIGVTVMNEPLTVVLVAGMALIFSGFIILAVQAYRSSSVERGAHEADSPTQPLAAKEPNWAQVKSTLRSVVNLGYIYGPISALSYACGYVGRKRGLLEIPDPFFGTMLGAVVGALIFVMLASFQPRYRSAVRATFTGFNGWLFSAGVAASVGQTLYFVALYYADISRVALITSMEVFITIFLSVWIFKTRENLTTAVIIAAFISVLGTIVLVW